MFALILIVFASCVLTVIFWAAVVAAAGVVLGAVWLLLQGIWWVVTRPIVWLIIRPIQFIFGIKREKTTNVTRPASPPTATIDQQLPPDPITQPTMTEKVEQLSRLKSLLESGAINQKEFDQMKGDVLAS